jgi:DNA recombination protein RmuC
MSLSYGAPQRDGRRAGSGGSAILAVGRPGARRGRYGMDVALILGIVIILLLVAALALLALVLRRGDGGAAREVAVRLAAVEAGAERTDRTIRGETNVMREEAAARGKALREEVGGSIRGFADSLQQRIDGFGKTIDALTLRNEERLEGLRKAIEERLDRLREENAGKLEQMRQTVDEKLQGTLEKRLGESFAVVSERLEKVHQGLGEMQNLATGVGDLKRVLTNVKMRGTWGEVQLGALLEQVLTPEQYCAQARIRNGNVDYAVRLPGQDADLGEVLLPIDAKFPHEDYDRLIDAHERGDGEALEAAVQALETRIKLEAKSICEKYVEPPLTTDFAIMFLPTEGLYAEVVRRPGLADLLQRQHRVLVTGPMTLGALLNSLQMGFRTLAIQKRSSEVWKVLGEAKTEFGKYSDVMKKLKNQLETATRTVDEVGVRTRAVERKLKGVESLELPTAPRLTAIAGGRGESAEDDDGSRD